MTQREQLISDISNLKNLLRRVLDLKVIEDNILGVVYIVKSSIFQFLFKVIQKIALISNI